MTKPRSARRWNNDKIGAQSFTGSAIKAGLPQDPKNQNGLRETMTISSDAFGWGPPVSGRGGPNDGSTIAIATAASYSGALDSLEGYNGAFQPPYYFGEAWADIIFKVPETKTYTLAEIQETAYIKYWRVDPGPSIGQAAGGYSGRQYVPNNGNPYALYAGNNINENVMQISASTNMLNLKKVYVEGFVETEAMGDMGTATTYREELSNQWSIQMKWETPHLNFNDKTIRPVNSDHGLTIPTLASESVPRGIWRQFGLIPQGDEGVYIGINDIPTTWLENNWYAQSGSNVYTRGAKTGVDGLDPTKLGRSMQSLVDLLGFDKKQKKLGQLKETKTVKEAVIAVPFIECEGTRKFFEVDREIIDMVMGVESGGALAAAGYSSQLETPGDSIVEMVEKMQNYIFPPKMDFLKYRTVTPFAMYIFEFEFEFDQDDLSYLWQNCAPRDYKSFKESTATVSHELLSNELMGLSQKETGKAFEDKVQWMVFKVKQRAATSYSALSSDGKVEVSTTETQVGDIGTVGTMEAAASAADSGYDYGYNWPYDYFSFVELVKIESSVMFGDTSGVAAAVRGGGSLEQLQAGAGIAATQERVAANRTPGLRVMGTGGPRASFSPGGPTSVQSVGSRFGTAGSTYQATGISFGGGSIG